MCGRYANSRSSADIAAEFEIQPEYAPSEVLADYNVAPTKEVPAVVERRPHRDSPEEPVRQLRLLRWGLVPSWAKDPKIGNRMINARMETVAEKPSFRRAFSVRRALLPADGYFEWYATDKRNAKGKPVKQPFFIRPRDGGIMAMAGLYEIWKDPTKSDDEPDAFRWTCTVLTTSAEDDLGHIHERMPLLVEPDRYHAWLDPDRSEKADLLELLVPAAPGRLEAYPVSTEVNNVRNNGPQLVDPIAVEE
ncbi:MAG TPA: SOS response-associated peptidase [Nocardioidaceae bacterium]|nr:SOS response-associated peptidase [Nocardioidaceae bacterium]